MYAALRKHMMNFLWNHWKTLLYNWPIVLISVVVPIMLYHYLLYLLPPATDLFLIGNYFVVMSTPFLFSAIFMPLIEEKETGNRELIQIATSYAYLNDISRFIISVLLFALFFAICLIFIVKDTDFGFHISKACIVMLILFYSTSIVALTFMISSLFESKFYAKLGGIIGFIFFMSVTNVSESLLICSSISSLVEMFSIIAEYEDDLHGNRGHESVWKFNNLI